MWQLWEMMMQPAITGRVLLKKSVGIKNDKINLTKQLIG